MVTQRDMIPWLRFTCTYSEGKLDNLEKSLLNFLFQVEARHTAGLMMFVPRTLIKKTWSVQQKALLIGLISDDYNYMNLLDCLLHASYHPEDSCLSQGTNHRTLGKSLKTGRDRLCILLNDKKRNNYQRILRGCVE